jgi:hypothetical protein
MGGLTNFKSGASDMAQNRLAPAIRFNLMKEFDNYVKSPRKLKITAEEFRAEASRELGTAITQQHIVGCCESFGLRPTDVFAIPPGAGRSVFGELYKLEQRVAVLEEKLKGL